MKKLALVLILFYMTISLSSCNVNEEKIKQIDKIVIAVSIPPEKTFVERVIGKELLDNYEIITLIPQGFNPENYSPRTSELISLSKAKIYFTIGVFAEDINILPKLKDLSNKIKLVSLDNYVGMYYDDLFFNNIDRDPHIWLSLRRTAKMIEMIKEEISLLDIINKDIYKINAEKYITELNELDDELNERFKRSNVKSFIIYHPSYGYFANDYNIEMISVEKDGKKATSSDIKNIIDRALNEKITKVFYQAEFDSKQAENLANEINGKKIMLDPLSYNYIDSIRRTADLILNEKLPEGK